MNGKDGRSMNSMVLKIVIWVTAIAGVGLVSYGAYTYKTNLDNQAKEAATQVVIEVKDDTEIDLESEVNKALEEKEVKVDYFVREVPKQLMYVTDAIVNYEGPSEIDFKVKSELYQNQEVHVIGVVEKYKEDICLWYLLEDNTFVNGSYLTDKPIVVESSGVDSKGVSIELGDDEYRGDDETLGLSEAEKNLKDMLDGGYITEEEYNELLEICKKADSGSENTSNTVNITVDESKMPPSTGGIETGAPDYGEVKVGEGDYSGLEHIRIN